MEWLKRLRFLGEHSLSVWQLVRIARALRDSGKEVSPEIIVSALEEQYTDLGGDVDLDRLLEIIEALMPFILLFMGVI